MSRRVDAVLNAPATLVTRDGLAALQLAVDVALAALCAGAQAPGFTLSSASFNSGTLMGLAT